MKLDVKLTGTDAIRKRLADIADRTAFRALAATAEDAQDYIERAAAKHHRDGDLEKSVYLRRIGPMAFDVGHDQQLAPYAKHVIWGSKAHEIRARNRQALSYAKDGIVWFWFGPKPKAEQARIRAWVRVKRGANARVMFRWPKHPGYSGDNWLQRAADQAPRDFEQHVMRQLASVVKPDGA